MQKRKQLFKIGTPHFSGHIDTYITVFQYIVKCIIKMLHQDIIIKLFIIFVKQI